MNVIDPERLHVAPLFADLSDDDLAWLAERFDESLVAEGGRATHEGMAGYAFFVIESGEAEVQHGDTDVRRLGPGDTFGEAAILGDGLRTAYVVARTKLELLVMHGARFRELQMQMPDVAASIESAMQQHRA